MSSKPVTWVPFRRGSDRRKQQSEHPLADARLGPVDRRHLDLSRSSLFRGVDARQVEKLVGDCEVLILPAGTPLLKPGQANDSVYLLLSGELTTIIDTTNESAGGIRIPAGESVGEMSAIDGKPVSALVVALSESRLLRLPPQLFWHEISAIPGVARNLLSSLTERMRRSNESILESQRKRLALEYLQQELETARQLQSSMLPARGPLFPERGDIEIEGMMEPASAIGGDFFDAFLVDDNRLFFCIGDVSGHGIPAALFMARTIGLLRIVAMTKDEPDHLLERVNDQLSIGNEANIFVTLFCGFLDITTGHLSYSNGGHLPPLLLTPEGPQWLPLPKGALVGAIPGLRYKAMETTLGPGTTLLCYTDGVTEAPAISGEEFGEPRMAAIAEKIAQASISQLLESLRREVADFTHPSPLADDCTMLALRRKQQT